MAISLYDSLRSSNLPNQAKSQIRSLFDRVSSGGRKAGSLARRYSRGRGTTALHIVRGSSESAATGALLAFLQVELKNGLDLNVFGKSVAIDGATSVLANLSALWLGINHDFTDDLLRVGDNALSIFVYRKFGDYLHQRKIANGGVPGGSTSPKIAGEEDPIVRAARNL